MGRAYCCLYLTFFLCFRIHVFQKICCFSCDIQEVFFSCDPLIQAGRSKQMAHIVDLELVDISQSSLTGTVTHTDDLFCGNISVLFLGASDQVDIFVQTALVLKLFCRIKLGLHPFVKISVTKITAAKLAAFFSCTDTEIFNYMSRIQCLKHFLQVRNCTLCTVLHNIFPETAGPFDLVIFCSAYFCIFRFSCIRKHVFPPKISLLQLHLSYLRLLSC